MDEAHLKSWIGCEETEHDVVTAAPVRAMRALLDRDPVLPEDGEPLPPLWHWLYFLPAYRTAEAGPDGHAARGGFLPPVPLPRRMWAGGRLSFPGALRVGERVTKTSTIADVTIKEGRSGPLAFVTVRHEIAGPGGPTVIEEHDIVYRGGPALTGAVPPPAPEDPQWTQTIQPGPLLLFRYSALTYNGHRIHYDRDYCRDEEGYPGLVVHGPLTATLLVGLAAERCPDACITAFDFRATAPLFDDAPYTVNGRREGDAVRLWAAKDGGLAMTATASLG